MPVTGSCKLAGDRLSSALSLFRLALLPHFSMAAAAGYIGKVPLSGLFTHQYSGFLVSGCLCFILHHNVTWKLGFHYTLYK